MYPWVLPRRPNRAFTCLELDVVHEGVSWFSGKGSRVYRQLISVAAGVAGTGGNAIEELEVPEYDSALLTRPSGEVSLLRFPMHAILQT